MTPMIAFSIALVIIAIFAANYYSSTHLKDLLFLSKWAREYVQFYDLNHQPYRSFFKENPEAIDALESLYVTAKEVVDETEELSTSEELLFRLLLWKVGLSRIVFRGFVYLILPLGLITALIHDFAWRVAMPIGQIIIPIIFAVVCKYKIDHFVAEHTASPKNTDPEFYDKMEFIKQFLESIQKPFTAIFTESVQNHHSV